MQKYGSTSPQGNLQIQEKIKKTNLAKYGVENVSQSKLIQEKKDQTNLKNLGVKNPSQSSSVKNKKKQTSVINFGVEHPATLLEIKNKTKETNLARYGVEFVQQNKLIKEKATQTCILTYGAKCFLQTLECKEEIKQNNKEKYNVEYFTQTDEFKTKSSKKLLEKYGVDNYSKTPEYLEKVRQTNLQKFNRESYTQTQEYQDRSRLTKIENGSILSLSNKEPLVDVCTSNNVKWNNAYLVYHKYGEEAFIKYCAEYGGSRVYSTEAALMVLLEKEFPDLTKYNKTPLEFKTSFRPDFRLEKDGKILYLNTDGLYWHAKEGGRVLNMDYHQKLFKVFQENNQVIFQFREDELQNKPNIVKSIILNYFNKHTIKYSARQLSIREVPSKIAASFFLINHLMGGYRASKSYGLYTKDGELVCCISVRKTKECLEIARFAGLLNTCTRGGFSKLLNHIENLYEHPKITSFCDMRYSMGKSYEKLGFILRSATLGWQWTDFTSTFNRLQCRANMDSRELTQAEHAKELKWYKIYDAGQVKYVKEAKK